MSEERFGLDELAGLEAALERLAPAPTQIERDRLMYSAGRRTVMAERPATRWLWPATTAAMTLVSVTLAVLLAQGHRQKQDTGDAALRVAIMPAHTPAATAAESAPLVDHQPLSQLAYLSLRQTVMRLGVDGIPDPVSETASGEVRSESLIDLRRRLLEPSDKATIDSSQEIGEQS